MVRVYHIKLVLDERSTQSLHSFVTEIGIAGTRQKISLTVKLLFNSHIYAKVDYYMFEYLIQEFDCSLIL